MGNKLIKVSIIIPVYNMSKWIEKCIISVEQQSLKELEIICIDDGSTDESLEKIKTLKQKYNNIVVLTQRNKGAGYARNFGIQYAKGEYISFCDADDFYISDNVIKYMYDVAKKNNALIVHGKACDLRDGVIITKHLRAERRLEYDGYILSKDFQSGMGWHPGIFNREFIISNDIKFPPYRRGQDLVFFVSAIAKAGKVYCINEDIYVYRKDHKQVQLDLVKAIALMNAYIDTLKISSEYGMNRIHQNCINDLKSDMGAVFYRYAFLGNKTIIDLLDRLNEAINPELLEEDMKGSCFMVSKAHLEEYKRDVYLARKEFFKILESFHNIYIFGAGKVAKKVNQYLKRNNINIQAFCVSDKSENPKEVDGVKVVNISEVDNHGKNDLIVIATYWFFKKDILNILKEMNFCNVYDLDYGYFLLWLENVVY